MKVINKYTTGIVIAFSQLEIAIIENALTSYVCDKNDKVPLWNETYKLNDSLLNIDKVVKDGKKIRLK